MTAPEASQRSRRRVVFVDDHTAFLDLLRFALDGVDDLEWAGATDSLAESQAVVAAADPDVVVVDLMLGDDDGLEAVRRLRASSADLTIVVASARSDPHTVASVVAAGGNGFAPKRGAFAELLAILRSARPGTMSVAPSLLTSPTAPPADPVPPRLTDRETQVLALMARGISVPAIAQSLKVSINTCRSHVSAVHRKLDARTQVEAVLKARKLGLIESPEPR